MFGRKPANTNELPLSIFATLPSNATEVARLWLTPDQSYVAVGYMEGWTPELLGSLLIECARSAAVAFAARSDVSEVEALTEIVRGMELERERIADESRDSAGREGKQ